MESAKQFILDENQEFLAISRDESGDDLQEIIFWSAEKNDLISPASSATSWNFHPLPSGNFCLSHTFRLGGGTLDAAELFTHGILITPQLLRDYANNAVLLMTHLGCLGFWRAGIEVTRQLQDERRANNFQRTAQIPVLRTITLDGGAMAVRTDILRKTVEHVGVRRFSTILDTILESVSMVLVGDESEGLLLEALLDALPVSCRTEISFSTGLKFSPERPFRVLCFGNEVEEPTRIRCLSNIPLIAAHGLNANTNPLPAMRNRWAMFLATVLEQKMESRWLETATQDTDVPTHMLSRMAIRYFREYGLDKIYQKLSKVRRPTRSEESTYQVLHLRVPSTEAGHQALADLTLSGSVQKGEKTISSADGEIRLDPSILRRYTATVSEALHGNPLAAEHLQDTFRTIAQNTPESNREEICDSLLTEGLRRWNTERANTPNHSWRQVEHMVDTLADMLDLWGETKGLS